MRLALIIGFIAQCALLQASTLIDGLYYDLDMATRTATVTYEKEGTGNYASLPANVKIPKSVEYNGVTYSVTKVANRAFANCNSLESISIPGTVLQIGDTYYSDSYDYGGYLPFYNCTALKSVIFEDGEQGIVLGAAYNHRDSKYCRGLFSYCPLEEVYIGRNISYQNHSDDDTFENAPNYYGYSAFYNQTKLAKAVISSSVTEIPKFLFCRCSALSDVDIQGPLVKIPARSFSGCNISALTLPGSVEDIGEYAFNSNTAMKSAVLGNNVKSIGNYAFRGCSNLANLDLGKSLVTIGDYAFESIGRNVNTGLNVVFPNTLSTIGEYAFKESGMSSITIPNSVTKIGKSCFINNTKLEKITIGNGCSELPEEIFSGCSALISVVLNDGLEKISYKAFYGCKSLESISIPSTVLQIGGTTFNECSSLKNVRFEDGENGLVLGSYCHKYKKYNNNNGNYYDVEEYRGLFSYCPLEEVYIGRNISYQNHSDDDTFEKYPKNYGYSAFYNQPKLTKVTISPAVTEIPAYLFYKNASLTMTSLPKVKKIGESAFQGCSKLTTLNLGEDLQVVGSDAFNGCKNVTKLTFPDATTTIGSRAFQDCSSVTEVTVGKGLKSIGANAFLNCKSFTALLLPNGFTTMGESAFEGCIKLTVAKLGKSLTAVPARAFKDCIALSEMRVPATVKSIGDEAFYNDYSLAVVSMQEGLEKIGKGVFYNNRGILEFSIPGTVTSIGQNCFYGCSNTSVMAFEDGEGVLTIDTKNTRSAKTDALDNYSYKNRKFDYFYDCPIEYLYLGRDLKYDYSDGTDIYDLVDNKWKQVNRASAPFANSTTLEEVEIGPEVTFVYKHLCENCDKLTSMAFPAGIQSIYDYAFANCDNLVSTVFSVGLQGIYTSAFANCPKLASTTFEESSEHTLSIYESAFEDCVSLENVTFPGQLSVLGRSAYSGCEKLKSVIFNKNEQYKPSLTIGNYTFDKCYLIKELAFPGRLESIGNYTFASCVNLTNVSFEDANTAVKLGYGASTDYKSNYSETLPLFGNSNLTSLYMGRNIDYETAGGNGYSPFYNQQNLTDVKFSQAGTVTYCKDNLLYKVSNCKTLILPESLTSIGSQTFRGMSTLGSIAIPNAVTTIGTYAFADDSELESAKLSTSCAWLKEGLFSKCEKLQAITIPTVVTKMDTQMFTNCKALKNVTFEDGTDLIEMAYGSSNNGCGLFRDCPVETLYLGRWLSYNTDASYRSPFYSIAELKNLTLGKDLKVVDKYMFSYCTGLENLYIPDNITSINMWGFRGCTSLKSVRFSEALSQISDYGFSGCTSLDNVALPASMTSIADNSFSGCTSLRKLDLGTSLRIIGPSAFQNCTALEGIEMPETLEGLGVESFSGCTSLPYVEVKGGISSVGKQSFQGCTGLTWISLSENVSSLGENSFDGCTNIKYVKSYATSPIPAGLANFPEDVVANGTLFVPASYVGRYKRSATWKDWGNIKAIAEGVFLSTVTLNQEDAHLEAGETLTLEATVGPDDAINKKVDWKSDDEAVATVSAEGVVTAHAVGQTTIRAIANDGGGAKATCTITVDPTKVASIALSSESLEIRKNRQAQLSATVAPANATDTRFVWSSTNEAVATVSEEGVVSAIAPGDAVIKAASQDGSKVEASCQVKVLPVLRGDSNDDDEVNVVDAVNTINYILNKVTGKFSFEAADVNNDGRISVSDVSGTATIVMQQSLETKSDVAMVKARIDLNAPAADCLVLSQNGRKNIDVSLDNNGLYSAMQTDIVLPNNVSEITVDLNDAVSATHLLTYAKMNAHTWRVMVYSLSNTSFIEGNSIFTLSSDKAMNAADIQIHNTIVSDAEATGYRPAFRVADPTSVSSVDAGNSPVQVVSGGIVIRGSIDTPVCVYTVSGILVKSFSLASEEVKIELPNGVYLVNMNNRITKTTVKLLSYEQI